ncbi:MAG: trypsin-like peptidase domain-containing protein, partial [Candidatus Promineifilaceae bacterium]|nr:trypsin-like peptidase domain-containing protein [Candidatus Promineifilaceae bacterium]
KEHPSLCNVTDTLTLPMAGSFPAGRYTIGAYLDGSMVYNARGIPNGVANIGLTEWFSGDGTLLPDCAPRLAVGVEPATGHLFWELSLPEAVPFEIPNGRIEADRVRFTEEASSGGGPNVRVFDGMELVGASLPQLLLFDEVVAPALPAEQLYLPLIRQPGAPPDPFGLLDLTAFIESNPNPGTTIRINDSISVEVVGTGTLIEEAVEMPSGRASGGNPADDPREPGADETGTETARLRLFDAFSQLEYEITVAGPLLAEIQRLRGGDDAYLPPDVAQDPALGYIGSRTRGAAAPSWGVQGAPPHEVEGWSNGVDSRIRLTSTTNWPWRTIAHFSNNCSGALVGPRHILTAAHCVNKRGTNQWYSFTVTPGRNLLQTPYGDSTMSPNPQPGDGFRWYFTPSRWRSSQYSDANCAGNCYAATEWDWALIIIPEHLGYQTGWMGYVARPASELNPQWHYNRGYPVCGRSNSPADCLPFSLYGDLQLCDMGNYLFQGSDGWNRVIRTACDISGGHSGSPVYHYFYDWQLGKSVPVAAAVVAWEHCTTCTAGDDFPNSIRRLTPNDIGIISFFRQWKP